MATRVFADQELEALRRFPEIGREELFRFVTLTPADIAFVDPGRGRGPADRLGLAVTLCTLPWLGFVPDEVAAAPRAAVVRLAERLGIDAARAGDQPRADPAGQPRPDRRALRRPAPPGRVAEVRPRHRVTAGREALSLRPAERPGRGAQGIRSSATHDLRGPLPVRPGVPAQDLPAAQQGRVAARVEAGPALRP